MASELNFAGVETLDPQTLTGADKRYLLQGSTNRRHSIDAGANGAGFARGERRLKA